MTIKIDPNLDNCIETLSKRKYRKLVHRYFRGEDGEILHKIDVLTKFLETADFNKLRGESEKHLKDGKKVKFILRSKNGQPTCEMLVEDRSP